MTDVGRIDSQAGVGHGKKPDLLQYKRLTYRCDKEVGSGGGPGSKGLDFDCIKRNRKV